MYLMEEAWRVQPHPNPRPRPRLPHHSTHSHAIRIPSHCGCLMGSGPRPSRCCISSGGRLSEDVGGYFFSGKVERGEARIGREVCGGQNSRQ